MSLEQINDTRAHCSAMREYDYILRWTAERHYPAGTKFELRAGRLRSFGAWSVCGVEIVGADLTYRPKLNPSSSEMWETGKIRLTAGGRLHYGLRAGEHVDIHLRLRAPVFADNSIVYSVYVTEPDNPWKSDDNPEPEPEEGSSCELTVDAGPVERVGVYSAPAAGADGTVRTLIVPEDRFGNPSSFENPVPVSIEWNGETIEQTVSDTLVIELDPPAEAVGRATVRLAMKSLALSENVENGRRDGGELTVIGSPVWRDLPDDLLPAFGEIHWHSELSGDGGRPIEDAFRVARDGLNMDFCAPGDHHPKEQAWKRLVAAVEDAYRPDEFATFFGWELGSDRGHENYYFTRADHPAACGGSGGLHGGRPADVTPLANEVAKRDERFLCIPHHTNTLCEIRRESDDAPLWHAYAWPEPRKYRRLVEIMQGRGNQERNVYDDWWKGWQQNNGASAQDALAAGHRLGFTGGTDNHIAYPGRFSGADNGGRPVGPRNVVLTGLWTKRIARDEVFDALYARHSWATWNARAIVEFRVNGALGGDEIAVKVGQKLTARIHLSATDALRSVEIVSAGESVWADSFNDPDVDVEVPLGEAGESTHFYLRALQRDGGIIYASPVFVDVE